MNYQLTRQALYDRVWEVPLVRLAPEFGTDPIRLSGLCKRYAVPIPGSGYWTKKGMGKPVTQIPLGPPPEGVADLVTIESKPKRAPWQSNPSAKTLNPATEAAEDPAVTEPVGVVAEQSLHRHVQRTHAKLLAGKNDGLVRVGGKGLFSVSASPPHADRVGLFLSDLVRAVEAKGWAVRNDDKGLRLVPDQEPIAFELTEQSDRLRHSPTEKELDAVRRHEEKRKIAARTGRWFSDWDAPKIPEWDHVPNGQLVLKFGDSMRWQGLRRTFSDGKQQRLEMLIEAMVDSLAGYAVAMKQSRIEAEERRLESIAAEERRREAQRRQELEAKRVEFLTRQLERHASALRVEAFIETFPASYQDDAVTAFLAWARGYADRTRQEFSRETLLRKLERSDLMNDEARIYSWSQID